MPTLGSLFDGIGGFPLAAVRNGIEPVWASEIEAFPIEVTRKRFPSMLHVGDITKLNGAELPPVDIITGGSPCQDLSVAGARAGLAGERSGLFMEQIRVVKEMRDADERRGRTAHTVRPRYMCWENVPGSFSSAGGEDFRIVLEEIVRIKDGSCSVPRPDSGRWESAGAIILGNQFSLAWRVMDAQFWGVAQRRKRIFLVADFAGRSAPQILFEQNRLPGYSASSGGQRQGTAASAPGCSDPPGGTGPIGFDGYNGDLTGEKAATLGVNCGMSTGRNGVLTAFAANQRDEVRDLHDVAAALTAQPGMKQQTFVAGITATGNGDCFLSEERHTALSGGGGMPGQGYPAIFTAAFSAGAGASAGSIGYGEEVSPTLKGTASGNCMHRNREPLLHCAVFLELTAPDYDALKLLQTDVLTELVRSKLNVDRLMLRQQEGFVSVMPAGRNAFGAQFERVLPASSVANLYPFNYSGKTDPHGFYIGKDKYGANILVDFDKRDDDKTSANILILGNSGQGKSYLLKLLLLNFLEAGKSVISLDVEHEQKDMCETVGGCFMDLMGGVYRINPLEPKCWDDGSGPEDRDAPEAFRKSTRLSQHISFLKDFFRAYKDFSDRHIDAIEIMVGKLYAKWGISDSTNFAGLKPQDYPILSDLYKLIEQEYREYDGNCHQLYTAELLQEILLGLHSMCQGAEAQFFNGHTNVTSSRFIVFGVKGLLQASKNVRGAMLFNILSYMSDRLLTIGNTTAALDELYVWLSDNVSVGTTIIEYIRNTLKRVRKKESNLIMASQNLEDFDREGIRELTKPLFAIPPHQFIFNCGSIDKRFYMDLLQLEEAEYNLIRFPQRGVCLFKCGNERYLLEVHAPAYKEALFGTAGGR